VEVILGEPLECVLNMLLPKEPSFNFLKEKIINPARDGENPTLP